MAYLRVIKIASQSQSRVVREATFSWDRSGGCDECEFVIQNPFNVLEDVAADADIEIMYDNTTTWWKGFVNKAKTSFPAELHVWGLGYKSLLADKYPGDATELKFGTAIDAGDRTIAATDVDSVVDYFAANWLPSGIGTGTINAGGSIDLTDFRLDGTMDLLEIIESLADIVGDVVWGVDESKDFYFKVPNTSLAATFYFADRDATNEVMRASREISRDGFNKLIIRGGKLADCSGQYVGVFTTGSGNRAITLCIPGINNDTDGTLFANNFFLKHPITPDVYEFSALKLSSLITPDSGVMRIYDQARRRLGDFYVNGIRYSFGETVSGDFNLGGTAQAQRPYRRRKEDFARYDRSIERMKATVVKPQWVQYTGA